MALNKNKRAKTWIDSGLPEGTSHDQKRKRYEGGDVIKTLAEANVYSCFRHDQEDCWCSLAGVLCVAHAAPNDTTQPNRRHAAWWKHKLFSLAFLQDSLRRVSLSSPTTLAAS